MQLDPIGNFFALLITILAICSMFAVIGLKKRLDEQTRILVNILQVISPVVNTAKSSDLRQAAKYGIAKDGENYLLDGESYLSLDEAVSKSEEKKMVKYGITKEGDKYKFSSYTYGKLSDAIAYAELLESKHRLC